MVLVQSASPTVRRLARAFVLFAPVSLGNEAVLEAAPPDSVFIEDSFRDAAEPKVHVLLGVNAAGRLLSTDAPKANWLDGTAFGFGQLSHGSTSASRRGSSVRIYVHKVPRCAGEELLDHFLSQEVGYGWDRAIQLHAAHMAAVHQAILNSTYLVSDPNNATSFYIPAFFGLLVERWLDTQNIGAINCMVRAWQELPEEFLLRNAGYDHFIVSGTCHPFSVCGTMECDITTYHPFAGNVMVLSGGIREYGSPDKVFTPAAVYPMLRQIFVPFPVSLDCARLDALSNPTHERSVLVSFVGSENSKIRQIVKRVVEDPNWFYADDPRVHIQVLADDQETARRVVLGGGDDAGSAWKSIDELYGASELCLLLPGHIYDFGRRAYDFLARGCVPVVVTLAPFFISVPFPGQLPWESLAIFAQIADESEAASLLHALIAQAASAEGRGRLAARRALLGEHAPRLFLPPHSNCGASRPSAMDAIAEELRIRQEAWRALRFMAPGPREPAELL